MIICNLLTVNSENCYEKMMDKDSHKIKYFTLGIILGFLVMFYGIISNNNVLIGIGIIVMGIDVVLLPFTTPETINFLGYQKSKFAGRIIRHIAYSSWSMDVFYSMINPACKIENKLKVTKSEELMIMWNELGLSGGTAIIILIALYFVIKWAVKNGIKEAYSAITGKKTEEDVRNEKELKELGFELEDK